jgi:hypothetical protein
MNPTPTDATTTHPATPSTPDPSAQALHPSAATDSSAPQAQPAGISRGPSPRPTLDALVRLVDAERDRLAARAAIQMEINFIQTSLAHLTGPQELREGNTPAPRERKLSKKDEAEFQLLVRSGVKLCHPALVHPARVDLATTIYRELEETYFQGDLEKLWTFLRTSQARLAAVPAPAPAPGEERAEFLRTVDRILEAVP